MYITQPTLSNHIHSLEKDLNATLFLRKKGMREVQLADIGHQFVPIAEKWQDLWKEGKRIAGQKAKSLIHISSISSINMYFTPQVYRQFMKRSSSEHIFLSSTQSYNVYRRVESGEAQIGFVGMPMFSARVSTTPLFREQMTFVCSCKSKYPENITPAQLNPQHEIMPN